MKKKEQPKLKNPTKSLVEEYNKKYLAKTKNKESDKAISALVKAFPSNTRLKDVYLKVIVINGAYSTQIYDTFTLAQHITHQRVDWHIRKGNPQIVSKIARVKLKDKTKNFYSFATKYCSFHAPNKFPIFDSFIERMLITYKNQMGFTQFKNKDLREYSRFIHILQKFKKHFGLEKFSLTQIDKFLWQYGKEIFA